jgi:hypothetical protein
MKTKIFSLTIVLLFSSSWLNAMDNDQIPLDELKTVDLENGNFKENLQTIPLSNNSKLNKFKTLFTNHTADEIIPRLQKFNNDQRTIKNWLKDQKVNIAQSQLYFEKNNGYKSYYLASALMSVLAGAMTSTKNYWPIAVMGYGFSLVSTLALIAIEKNNFQYKKDIQTSIYKNEKIRTLLSAIRNMQNKNLSTRLQNEG